MHSYLLLLKRLMLPWAKNKKTKRSHNISAYYISICAPSWIGPAIICRRCLPVGLTLCHCHCHCIVNFTSKFIFSLFWCFFFAVQCFNFISVIYIFIYIDTCVCVCVFMTVTQQMCTSLLFANACLLSVNWFNEYAGRWVVDELTDCRILLEECNWLIDWRFLLRRQRNVQRLG